MRRWMIGLGVVWATVLGAVAAQACILCDASLSCALSPAGGRWCVAGNAVCMMGGLCSQRTGTQAPVDDLGMFQMTLLDDAGSAAGSAAGTDAAPARVVRGAGPVAVGRQAVRIARGPAAGFGDSGAIVFSGRGYSEGGTAVFRSASGDGFTLSRESDGRGARLRVCALAGHSPGRVLAEERLNEEDALVVRVPFEGRTRVLVLQAATLPRAEALRREAEVARAIRDAAFGQPEPLRPPFELEVLDR